jgi:hypothetical protein
LRPNPVFCASFIDSRHPFAHGWGARAGLRADFQLTTQANPLKRAFHSKPVEGNPAKSAHNGHWLERGLFCIVSGISR